MLLHFNHDLQVVWYPSIQALSFVTICTIKKLQVKNAQLLM